MSAEARWFVVIGDHTTDKAVLEFLLIRLGTINSGCYDPALVIRTPCL